MHKNKNCKRTTSRAASKTTSKTTQKTSSRTTSKAARINKTACLNRAKKYCASERGSVIIIILAAVGTIALLGAIAVVVVLLIIDASSNKLICESKTTNQNITIKYNDDGKIIGYSAVNMSYKLEEQQKVAERIGIEQYKKDFESWYTGELEDGTCHVEEKNKE